MTEPFPHLDLDALADALAAREGDAGLAPSGHLAGCASCTSRLAELAAAEARVVATLSALPDPPLPAGLAERLSAALAAEPALEASDEPAGATVTPLAPARLRRRWLPAAAAAVLVVSGAGLGWSLLSGSDAGQGGDTAASALDGSTKLAAPLVTNSGIDWADPAAVDATLPDVLGGTAARTSTDGMAAADAQAALPAPAADAQLSAESGTSSGAGGQVGAAPAPPTELSVTDADPLATLRTPEGLASCLAALLSAEEREAGVQPLALDYARFEGAPALALVLPDPDPSSVQVFVVGPGCREGSDEVLGFVRRPRP